VFRRVVASGHRLQIGVDVGRSNRMAPSLPVVVLEQIVAGDVATRRDGAGEALVGEIDVVLDAALAAKREAYAAAADVNVSVPERRQPERAVGARVLVVADANERLLEQLDDEREDLVARQVRAPEILGRPP